MGSHVHPLARLRLQRRGARRALLLMELLMLLSLFTIISLAAIWAMHMGWDASRRTAEQANRQRAMQTILRQLRIDLASGGSVRLSAPAVAATASSPQSEPSAPDEQRLCVLSINSARGAVTYDLRAVPEPAFGNPVLRRVRPSGQSLTRAAEDGRTITWSLYGQYLTLGTRAAAAGTLLDVRFETRQHFESGDETLHRFETALLARGGR